MTRRLVPAALALATLAACIVLYQYVVVPAGPFSWDESSHAVYGLRQALHLSRGEWGAFLRENTNMGAWAFLHAWMLAAVYLVAGATVVHARALSLLCCFLFVQVFYRLAAECAPRAGWLAGLLACAFALTSPELLLYACKAMLEVPALLVGWTALWFYLRTLRDEGSGRHLTAGVLAVATLFTRYEYGLYLMATILLVEGVRLLLALGAADSPDERRRRIVRRLGNAALLFLLFEVAVVSWWSYHEEFRRYALLLWEEMTSGYVPYTKQRVPLNRAWLLFHPTVIARDYSATLAGFALMVVGCLAALRRVRDLRRLTLLALFAIGYPVVFLKFPYAPDTQWWPFLEHARYLMMLVPALWVLAAVGLVDLGELLSSRGPRRAILAAAGGLAVLVFGAGAARVYGDIFSGRYAGFAGASRSLEPYLQALRAAFEGENGPVRAYLITGVPEIPPGEVEWQILRARPSAQVQVSWPPWPENPDGGYVARLRSLLDAAGTNWIVATEPRTGQEGGYLAAAAELPELRLVTRYTSADHFVLKVYRRESSEPPS